ncbi:thioredoxin [Corynebacterium frankenforstense]
MSAAVTPVTQATFRKEVVESDVPVLVDFWAEWCGPCKALRPELEKVADKLGERARVVSVDVDSERGLAAMFQVLSIPTVVIYSGGKQVDEFTGARPAGEILRRVEKIL